MLKLKLQCFGNLVQRTDSFGKTLMWERLKAGEGDNRGWDDWMASPTQWTWVWVSSRSWWWTGEPRVLQSMGLNESDTVERLNWENWTEGLPSDITSSQGTSDKEPTYQCRRHKRQGFNPSVRKPPGEGHGNPLQYSCPENSHGEPSLAGYSPRGHKESDTTEET